VSRAELEPPPYALDVLEVVERIPAGRVMSYGDVAEFLGAGGPRQVGWVMSHFGSGVPWWRVLRADGSFLSGHETRALAAYLREKTPLRPDASRVDMRRARWDGA
jgi:alkylated DNA nucleotide flippase Atl1